MSLTFSIWGQVLGGDAKPRLLEPAYTFSWGRVGHRAPNTTGGRTRCRITRYANAGGSFDGVLEMQVGPNTVVCLYSHFVSFCRSACVRAWLNCFSMCVRPCAQPAERGLSLRLSARNLSMHSIPSTASLHPHLASPSPVPQKSKSMAFDLKKRLSLIGFTKPSPPSPTPSPSRVVEKAVSRDPGLVLLCLKTLGSLSLSSTCLIRLVQQSVIPYLDSDDSRVRKEAAITCANMIVNAMNRNVNSIGGASPTGAGGVSAAGSAVLSGGGGIGAVGAPGGTAEGHGTVGSKTTLSAGAGSVAAGIGPGTSPSRGVLGRQSLHGGGGPAVATHASHGLGHGHGHGPQLGGGAVSGHSGHDIKMLLPSISEATEQAEDEAEQQQHASSGANSLSRSSAVDGGGSVAASTRQQTMTPPRSQLQLQLSLQAEAQQQQQQQQQSSRSLALFGHSLNASQKSDAVGPAKAFSKASY